MVYAQTPPGAPTNLTATSSDGQIVLSWTAPSDDIVGYNVYRCVEPCDLSVGDTWIAWVANPGDEPPAPTEFTDTHDDSTSYEAFASSPVSAGTTYRYAVSADNSDYEHSDWSNEVTITATGGVTDGGDVTDAGETPPGAPTGLTATPGDTGIVLSWTAPGNDIVGYSVYRCEEGETPCTPEWLAWVANDGDAPPAPTTYTDDGSADADGDGDGTQEGLMSGATYRYVVTANDAAYAESDWSNEVTAMAVTGEGPVASGGPLAPTNLTAIPGVGQITLYWTPPAGPVTGWELLTRAVTDEEGFCRESYWMSITPTGTTTMSYTVSGLTNGTQYAFWVRAVNGEDKGVSVGLMGETTIPGEYEPGEFAASFESGLQWFRRDVVPALSGTTHWRPVAWKDERIQQHILVGGVPPNTRIALASSALTSEAGDVIPASAVSFRYPRFVAGHTEVRSCSEEYAERNTTAHLSDALLSAAEQATSPAWPELAWMAVDIPSETPAGDYLGTVTVSAVSGENPVTQLTLQVSIQVTPWALPATEARQFHLDLWQFPISVLDRYNDANPSERIALWSDEHYALLEPTYRYLAGLGQRSVTAYIKDDALGAPSMIQWTLKRDGEWDYDYAVFDTHVERLAEWGLDKQISAFSPVGWNWGETPYWDEATQSKKTFYAYVGSADWHEHWVHFLTDFRSHLLEKSWFDKTVLYLDESSEEDMEAVINAARAVDDNWKIGLAYVGYGGKGPGEHVMSRVYDASDALWRLGSTYVDSGLIEGETYRYAVDACNDGCSVSSAPVTLVAQAPAVPGAPAGLSAASAAGIELSWTAPATSGSSALTGYNVYRCVEENTTPCTPVWLDRMASGSAYIDRVVSADTTYRYTVEACNGSGCGNRADEVTVVAQAPQDRVVPGTPTELTAQATSAAAIELRWTVPAASGSSAVSSYHLHRCVEEVSPCTLMTYQLNVPASGNAVYTDRGVTADTVYRYALAACNEVGCGNRSDATTVLAGTAPNPSVPGVPADLAALAASPTAIQLEWTADATQGYDVYRCMGSETCTPATYLDWNWADYLVVYPNQVSTFYTSCLHPRPNSFVAAAADPVDMTALPWYALQRGQRGYLRWAFDHWRLANPLDARDSFTAGDFSLVYRSSNDKDMTVVPSIRAELLREGIEDFEKVQVLRESLSGCGADDLAGRWLRRLERTVDTFSSAALIAGRAGELINQAHKLLGEISQQVSPDMCQ